MLADDPHQPSAQAQAQAQAQLPSPLSPTTAVRWLGPGEIARNLLAAVVLSVIVYGIAGQSFLFFGSEIAAYYLGTTTNATITVTNAPGFFGIPSDDAVEQLGAIGVYRDNNGTTHTLFIQHANVLHQQVLISYLPPLPGVAVERADYEQNAAFYIILFSLSALILYAYWRFILRHLLRWRVKQDWKIKAIYKKTRDVMPRRATYRM
jgi:hypothetical protein